MMHDRNVTESTGSDEFYDDELHGSPQTQNKIQTSNCWKRNFLNLKQLLCLRHRKDSNRTQHRREVGSGQAESSTTLTVKRNSMKKSLNGKKGRKSKYVKDHDYCCCREANLPPPKKWKYRPIYIQPARDTICNEHYRTSSIPIGVPLDFETSLFKGRVLIRIRNDMGIDEESQPYFKGKNRKRQFVIQGQFKERINMSDVYIGDFYERPLGLVPPPSIDKIMKAFFRRITPGLIMDLSSDKPKVCTLLAGGVQIMSIDEIGAEPDILQYDLEENTKRLQFDGIDELNKDLEGGFKSISHRQKVLGSPAYAKMYYFEPGQTYTFNQYDSVFDLANYRLDIPMIRKLNLAKILNAQPTTLRASLLDGRSVFNFIVFHESLYQSKGED